MKVAMFVFLVLVLGPFRCCFLCVILVMFVSLCLCFSAPLSVLSLYLSLSQIMNENYYTNDYIKNIEKFTEYFQSERERVRVRKENESK